MKKVLLVLLSLGCHASFCQVIKDLDKDGVNDTVRFDPRKGVLICRLSTQEFRPVTSKAALSDEMNTGVRATKNGFEFFVGYMRAGYANQFRYETQDQKIRLIGMSRYEFGPASNNGSGESSVNLLTNNYIGNWNAFDEEKRKLVKMSVLEAKMYFPKIYLENYDASWQDKYQEKCSALYYKQRSKYK